MILKSLENKRAAALLISIILIIPPGLLTKFYPAQDWVSHYLGGVFYEIFFCLLAALFLPGVRPRKIAGWVFVITAALEFLQLYHPAWLTMLRGYRLAHLLIGSTFNIWDFPHYLLGCLLGGIWVGGINRFIKTK